MGERSSVNVRNPRKAAGEAIRVPLAQEEVRLEKHSVETGRVRVRTLVEEKSVVLRDTVERQSAEIERVPVARVVTRMPKVRQEGEVTIIPIVEERLVATRQLVLVEEVRVRRAARSEPVEIAATRRRTRAEIEHDIINPKTGGEDDE